MKVWKRIIGIALTLALILQCGQGIVIGKAQQEPGNTVSINSNGTALSGTATHYLEQWWDNGAVDLSVSGLNPGESYMYECQFVDSSGTPLTPLTGISNQANYHIGSLSTPYRWGCSLVGVNITGIYRISSAYTWMNVSVTPDGSSYTVTNTSSNNVTSFVVNGETIEEALGLNQTLTRPLPAANADGIVEINLTKANYVSIAAMYPDRNAIWFVPTTAQMSEMASGNYRIAWAVANNSTDYRVNSYNLSLHYKINGQDKYATLTEKDAVEARGTKQGGYSFLEAVGSFEFVELTIQNVSYTKDIDPTLEHTALSGPTVGTSSLNYKTYVTWSLVNFGTYALQADGGMGPIEWRVLEYDASSDKIVLMANKALFSMAYEPTMFGSTWESSALRSYLNKDFINDAFPSQREKDALAPVILDNSGSGSTHSLGGTATTDKVYVLSVAEINNPKYGLYGGDATNSVVETRQFGATEATLTNTNLTKKTYAGETFVNYYLRTPGYYQYDVAGVAPSGLINTSGWRTYTKTAAVCPVVTLNYSAAVAAGLTWKGSVYKQVASGYNTATAQSVKATPTKKLNKLSVGDTTTVNNVTYKVTKTTNKAKTVAVVGIKKSAKKVVIPSTIKAKGATYKVTSIKANAFKSAKNNLKSITIKSKHIKTMNNKAFNGLTKKTTVKISKAQYKKYKKLIKNDKLIVKKN